MRRRPRSCAARSGTGKLCPDAVEAVLACAGQPARRDVTERLAGLTPREIEVLRLIAAGQTAKEAARELEIAPKTADNHIQSLYSKIGVTTRAGAALYALERGLVQEEHRRLGNPPHVRSWHCRHPPDCEPGHCGAGQGRRREMILATTTVDNFDQFLKIFSTKGAEKRKQHGSKGCTVFRDPSEENRVWAIFDWDEKGWASFVSDPEVPPIMKEAGHQGRPQSGDARRTLFRLALSRERLPCASDPPGKARPAGLSFRAIERRLVARGPGEITPHREFAPCAPGGRAAP